jgi:hypothetical protein
MGTKTESVAITRYERAARELHLAKQQLESLGVPLPKTYDWSKPMQCRFDKWACKQTSMPGVMYCSMHRCAATNVRTADRCSRPVPGERNYCTSHAA